MLDKSRYPYFVRVGSGTQKSRNQYGQDSDVAYHYQYLIGGTPMRINSSDSNQMQFNGNLFEDRLPTYGQKGDSRSPLLVYDADARFTLENGYVDLGAYRYILANNNNDYRLYNPLRDAQVNHGASTQTQELS